MRSGPLSDDPTVELLCRRVYLFVCRNPGVTMVELSKEFSESEPNDDDFVVAVALNAAAGRIRVDEDPTPHHYYPVGEGGPHGTRTPIPWG